jgi:hypothetical protein
MLSLKKGWLGRVSKVTRYKPVIDMVLRFGETDSRFSVYPELGFI